MPLTLTEPEVVSTSYDRIIIIRIDNRIPDQTVTIDYIVLQTGEENPLTKIIDGPDGPERVMFNESEYTTKRKIIYGYDDIKVIYNNIDNEIQNGKSFEDASKTILYNLLGQGQID